MWDRAQQALIGIHEQIVEPGRQSSAWNRGADCGVADFGTIGLGVAVALRRSLTGIRFDERANAGGSRHWRSGRPPKAQHCW